MNETAVLNNWVGILIGVLALLTAVARWGKDRHKWDEAARVGEETQEGLAKIGGAVTEVLHEIRGVHGRGGIHQRLDGIDHELGEVRTEVDQMHRQRHGAETFAEIYKRDLQHRNQAGKPARRKMDQLAEDALSTEEQ